VGADASARSAKKKVAWELALGTWVIRKRRRGAVASSEKTVKNGKEAQAFWQAVARQRVEGVGRISGFEKLRRRRGERSSRQGWSANCACGARGTRDGSAEYRQVNGRPDATRSELRLKARLCPTTLGLTRGALRHKASGCHHRNESGRRSAAPCRGGLSKARRC